MRKMLQRCAAIALSVSMFLSVSSTALAAEYVVVSGDNLSKIATMYDTNWWTLAELNNLSNPSLIYPDQVIQLPSTVEEVVVPEVVATPAPEVVATPAPVVVATPEPEIVATPEPEVVATPEPEVVAPEVTETADDDMIFHVSFIADTHMDEETQADVLDQTIANVIEADPEFIVELGDFTMFSDYDGKTKEAMVERAEYVVEWMEPISHIDMHLVAGNWDGERGFSEEMMLLARETRLEYFPTLDYYDNFSGDNETAHYYSFTYGNAQFIILDAFTFCETSDYGWGDTLGITQYNWFKDTLATSESDFKFVFIHNLLGGYTSEHRGGTGIAHMYEWGGENADGVYEFDEMRPDFEMPIHDLMVEYGVDALFHGHDHLYAREELDGIAYVVLPQPSVIREHVDGAVNKNYFGDIVLPSAGYMNVYSYADEVIFELHKTLVDEEDGYYVADAFSLDGNGNMTTLDDRIVETVLTGSTLDSTATTTTPEVVAPAASTPASTDTPTGTISIDSVGAMGGIFTLSEKFDAATMVVNVYNLDGTLYKSTDTTVSFSSENALEYTDTPEISKGSLSNGMIIQVLVDGVLACSHTVTEVTG